MAHPPDHEWNGFTISGAEGLEAGLISAFNLPWNMRGGQPTAAPRPSPRAKGGGGGRANKVMEAVRRRPGMTELEIATSLYGPGAVQQQVNHDCRRLVEQGLVERRGAGGSSDPYIYYPVPTGD